MCRKTIPPTKEMKMQLENNRKMLAMIKEKLEMSDEELLMDVQLRGLSHPVIYGLVPPELFMQLPMFPKKEQIACIRAAGKTNYERFTEMVTEMEGAFADYGELPAESEEDGFSQVELPWELHDAAQSGDIWTVLEWLGVDPENVEASYDNPPPKEKIDARNPQKLERTLLHEAEFENHTTLMSLLLQLGASVDPRSVYGQTPFGQACVFAYRCEDAARLLLQWGAVVENCIDSRTAVTAAEEADAFELARLLEAPLGGRRCEILGLANRTDLNGLTGVAIEYYSKRDRYAIELESTKEKVLVKPENLKRRDRTPADPGVLVEFP